MQSVFNLNSTIGVGCTYLFIIEAIKYIYFFFLSINILLHNWCKDQNNLTLLPGFTIIIHCELNCASPFFLWLFCFIFPLLSLWMWAFLSIYHIASWNSNNWDLIRRNPKNKLIQEEWSYCFRSWYYYSCA